HAQKLRNLQRLLALHVHARALQGDYDSALDTLDTMYATAHTLEYEMCLVEHLVHLALLGSAFEETEWLLNQTQFSDAQLARLQQRLQAIDAQSGLTTGLMGERAMTYHTFHHLGGAAKDFFPGGSQLPITFGTMDGQLGRPADCLKSLELLTEVVD